LSTAIERLIELDEEASAKQRERVAYLSLMNAVIEALPDALIVADAAGKIVLFNERAEFMFGYPRSEVIGEAVEKLLPERDRARHRHDRETYNRFEISQRARTMGVGMDLLGLRADGQEFPVDITLARMVVPKGIFNLALIRYSPRVLACAPYSDGAAASEPNSEDADAGG
jgi:PAS domain S-box-containing protein